MSDDDLGLLTARLAALDRPIRTWVQSRERAFSATFAPKEGKLSSLMGRLPRAAAAAAGVGAGPQAEVFALFDEVCDLYGRSDAARCAIIRGIVHGHEAADLLESYMAHAAKMIESGGRQEWLDRGIAAASIDDQRRDYRDWIIAVGDIYVAARNKGLDPAPVMRRIADRSNAALHPAATTPTREALERFEQSAYFGTSVLPRLR